MKQFENLKIRQNKKCANLIVRELHLTAALHFQICTFSNFQIKNLSFQGGSTTHNLGQLGSDGSLAGAVVRNLEAAE